MCAAGGPAPGAAASLTAARAVPAGQVWLAVAGFAVSLLRLAVMLVLGTAVCFSKSVRRQLKGQSQLSRRRRCAVFAVAVLSLVGEDLPQLAAEVLYGRLQGAYTPVIALAAIGSTLSVVVTTMLLFFDVRRPRPRRCARPS